MSERLALALAQLDPVVGDIPGNAARLTNAWREAARRGADLVVTSELFLTGYPPEDFILKPRVRKVLRESIDSLARDTASGPAILLGTPWEDGGKLYNAALLLEGGEIVAKTFKRDLPNYGVFDEKRLFAEGALPTPMAWRGNLLGVMICEDMWKGAVAAHLKSEAAEILIVLNGSPFEPGKQRQRMELARKRIDETGLPLIYVNQFGGQDELVFEGASFALDRSGEVRAQARAWGEEVTLVQCERADGRLAPCLTDELAPQPDDDSLTYLALMTAVRDYVGKNNFPAVLIGLSGGIDSALVATLAADALGPERVRCVMMPSPYTSNESLEDAAAIAKNIGCRLDTIAIEEGMQAFESMLAEAFMGCPADTTEENIQARLRGMILMALSNKSGAMVLSTGNKSELAVGYATLYGDMCGGFAPLKDVYKTDVYRLSLWRNANRPDQAKGPSGAPIPPRVLTKAPTAELKPFQTDQDTLPPYATLDGILHCLIEQDLGVAETVTAGFDPEVVKRVYTMLDRAEYKRRQGPPGPKVSRRHITRDRRYPITNRYADKWRTGAMD